MNRFHIYMSDQRGIKILFQWVGEWLLIVGQHEALGPLRAKF